MGLSTLIRGMLPMLPKENVVDSITKSKEAIEKQLIPSLDRTIEIFKGKKFNSGFANDVNAQFQKRSMLKSRGSFLNVVRDILGNILETEDYILTAVSSSKQSRLATEALTLYEVNILAYQNAAVNIVEYTSRLLSLFWIAESNVASGKEQYKGVLVGEISWLLDGLHRYLLELSALDRKKGEVEADMKELSNLIFDPDNEDTIRALADKKQIDPMGFGFIPVAINPWFHIGRWIAEVQNDRYEALKLDKQRIDMRIEMAKSGIDPNNERLLKALDKRREDIQIKLNKIEEK